MSKSRVYEIAKELNVDSKLIIEKLKAMDVDVKNHMSSITEAEAAKVKQAFQKPAPKQPEKPKMEAKPEAEPEVKQTEIFKDLANIDSQEQIFDGINDTGASFCWYSCRILSHFAIVSL